MDLEARYLTLLHAKNNSTDQPAHLRSLISAFVIGFLKSMTYKLASYNISSFWLVYVAERTVSSRTLSETPMTDFCARLVEHSPLFCILFNKFNYIGVRVLDYVYHLT